MCDFVVFTFSYCYFLQVTFIFKHLLVIFVAVTTYPNWCYNQWWILSEANEAVASGPPSKIAHTVLNPLQMFVQRTIPSEDLFFF